MKKTVTLLLFITLITAFIVYKSQSRPDVPIDRLNLNNTMVVTEDGIEIPLDSVLAYYNDPAVLVFSSKTLIVRDLETIEGQFNLAIKRYLRTDSIRKAQAQR